MSGDLIPVGWSTPWQQATKGLALKKEECYSQNVAKIWDGTARDTFGDTDTINGVSNVVGTSSADVLIGSKGDDELMGGRGDDFIYGQAGSDILTGGQGSDVFYYDINERDYGDLVGLNKQETADKFGKDQVHIWRRSYDTPPPNGESLKDVVERVSPYFKENIKHRSLDDIKPGGLGTYFIQQIMDEVVFKEATGWHNNLVLTKHY